MITLTNEHINTELEVGRCIGEYTSGLSGPLFIAVAGIHGNEPSGVFAIDAVLRQLRRTSRQVKGRFVGLAGNLEALSRNRRCIDKDLNRCFREERFEELEKRGPTSVEEKELLELAEQISELTADAQGPVFFVDCHTTSSATIPYISVNEYEQSLWLADQLPLYKVIGLEKSIPGCLAEYYNKVGFHGFTCEAGQHEDLSSIEHHEAIIWLMMNHTGVLSAKEIACYDHFKSMLEEIVVEGKKVFHLAHHYTIQNGEEFRMKPGYVNFKRIRKHEVLAKNRFGNIKAPTSGRILMPLYQEQGDDGFFIVSKD